MSITTMEGTSRILVTRYLTEEADVFEAIPPEFKATISEVHYADQIGQQGTYGIEVDEEWARNITGASNLVDLVEVDPRRLGARLVVDETPAEIIDPLADSPLMEGVPDAILYSDLEEDDGPYQKRSYRAGPITDQGREGACTGFGLLNWINGGPLMDTQPNQRGFEFYEWNKDNDEWPGDDYEGSSVSASCKQAIQRLGIAESAAVTSSFDEMVRWKQSGKGGILISTPWYEGMYRTDARGFIRPTGRHVGGHCIWDRAITSWLSDIWYNSWGLGFGYKGNGWVAAEDKKYLIRQGLRGYMMQQTSE